MTHPESASSSPPGRPPSRPVPALTLAPAEPPAPEAAVGVATSRVAVAEAVRQALVTAADGDGAAAPAPRVVQIEPGSAFDRLLAPGIAAIVLDVDVEAAAAGRLQRLAAVGPDAPIVAILRGMTREDEIEALEAGAAEAVSATRDGVFNGAEMVAALARARARHAAAGRPVRIAENPRPTAAALMLVQEAPEAMVVLDRHGTVTFVNPAAEELLGHSAADLLGKPFDLTIRKDGEITIVQPGGETRTAEMEIIETERGGVPALVATFTDTTVRRKLEAAIRSAQAGRDMALTRSRRFFSRVGHDLRTPLTHIIGFSELLQKPEVCSSEAGRDYAASIAEAGRTMLDMVEDLFSVVEGTPADVAEPCDLVKLVRNTAHFAGAQARRSGLEVTVDASPERLVARVDLARLQRALYRLVSGIARGAAGPGLLRLGLRRAGRQARLTIRLDGAQGRPVPLPASLADNDPLTTPADARTGFAAELLRETLDAHGGALQLARDQGHVVAAVLTLPLRD